MTQQAVWGLQDHAEVWRNHNKRDPRNTRWWVSADAELHQLWSTQRQHGVPFVSQFPSLRVLRVKSPKDIYEGKRGRSKSISIIFLDIKKGEVTVIGTDAQLFGSTV